MNQLKNLEIKNLNHLGIIAGIVDEIGIVEIVNEQLGTDKKEIVNPGVVIKAIILNGLGFVARPLYLFPQFFEDKATAHLLGQGIFPEHLNDDKIGRVMDKCYDYGISELFLLIALAAVRKYQVNLGYSHLDSTSFSVHGEYKKLLPLLTESSEETLEKAKILKEIPIKITQYHLIFQSIVKEKLVKKQKNRYQIIVSFKSDAAKITLLKRKAGRFIIATNKLDNIFFTSNDILKKYKERQAPERGFAFLKDPLFLRTRVLRFPQNREMSVADSVFLKNPQRVETMAMLMGLCLLVYSLGQRQIRTSLQTAKTGIQNQLGKLTERPTLRWIFQCFQGIHLVEFQGIKQIANLTDKRQFTLNFFPLSCRKYYILSG
ncbi:MAG: IS1634 family transposase [Cyanobacteriota bacterium]|nr:IS1634 family transposase [Cyanobacteriota bacterium]